MTSIVRVELVQESGRLCCKGVDIIRICGQSQAYLWRCIKSQATSCQMIRGDPPSTPTDRNFDIPLASCIAVHGENVTAVGALVVPVKGGKLHQIRGWALSIVLSSSLLEHAQYLV